MFMSMSMSMFMFMVLLLGYENGYGHGYGHRHRYRQGKGYGHKNMYIDLKRFRCRILDIGKKFNAIPDMYHCPASALTTLWSILSEYTEEAQWTLHSPTSCQRHSLGGPQGDSRDEVSLEAAHQEEETMAILDGCCNGQGDKEVRGPWGKWGHLECWGGGGPGPPGGEENGQLASDSGGG